MIAWIVAGLLGAMAAVLAYPARASRGTGVSILPAVLRVVSVTLLVALIAGAPAGGGRLEPIVALDASQSWLRGGDSTAWRAALERARALRPDSLILFGDSVHRAAPSSPTAAAAASRLAPLVAVAAAAGRPAIILTDGELDGVEERGDLPAGSSVELFAKAPQRDAAVVSVDAPRAVSPGDSLDVRVVVRGGGLETPAGTVALLVNDAPAGTAPMDSLAPFGETTVSMRARLPRGLPAHTLLRAVVRVPGDREARNDTLTVPLEITDAPGAVLISSSPDYDARYVLHVLRGSLALPVRAFVRVAPAQWRTEGTLTPVTEAEIRAAARAARLLVLHGDTSILGPPRSLGDGALALLAPPDEHSDWYAVDAPVSPLAAQLRGVPWDSLSPIDVSPRLPSGAWVGLETQRSRRFERRPAIAGGGDERRWVVVGAAGLWQWYFRGGVAADAYTALWGSIFDWLTADRHDARRVLPTTATVRSGDPIEWRRAASADSVVRVTLRLVGGSTSDSLDLRFAAGAATTESPAMPPGVYEVEMPGGAAQLAVNASTEMLPRRAADIAGPAGSAATHREASDLRGLWWVYAVVVLSLCGEWIVRRRKGLR